MHFLMGNDAVPFLGSSHFLCHCPVFTAFQPPVDRGSVYWGRHRVDRPVQLPKSMMSRHTQFTCVYPVDGVHRPETEVDRGRHSLADKSALRQAFSEP